MSAPGCGVCSECQRGKPCPYVPAPLVARGRALLYVDPTRYPRDKKLVGVAESVRRALTRAPR